MHDLAPEDRPAWALFQDTHWPLTVRHPFLCSFIPAWGWLKILPWGRKNWLSFYPMFFQLCCLWYKMYIPGSVRILVSVTQMAFLVNHAFSSELQRAFLNSKAEGWCPGSAAPSQQEGITQGKIPWCPGCLLTQGKQQRAQEESPGVRMTKSVHHHVSSCVSRTSDWLMVHYVHLDQNLLRGHLCILFICIDHS